MVDSIVGKWITKKRKKFLSYLYETLQNTRTLLLRCKLQLVPT